jgi:adenine phosphoribosyltransferase
MEEAARGGDPVIQRHIRDVPDFPKPGIVFKDITPLLQSAEALRRTLDLMAEAVHDQRFDLVCGIESRGFIFGTALARQLGKGFIPIRKPGKLPWKTAAESYELEYGTDTIEIHVDAAEGGRRVLMVDDLLATGGTMQACVKLAEQGGAEVVGCAFVIELAFLGGRAKLSPHESYSLIRYDGAT